MRGARGMRRQLAAALLGAALLTGGAQAVAEPTAARYVADEADVLSSETEQYIIDKNQSLFEDTGGEIVVVSVDFMDGMDAADYAMAVAEKFYRQFEGLEEYDRRQRIVRRLAGRGYDFGVIRDSVEELIGAIDCPIESDGEDEE